MQTETTKPLYKMLNEKRTQGTWKYDGLTKIKADNTTIYSELKTFRNNVVEDAQYTALAVNNLHILAEALECMKKNIEQVGVNARTVNDITNLAIAREALAAIS